MNDTNKVKLLGLIKKAEKAGKLDSALWTKIVSKLNKASRKDTFNTVVNMDLSELSELVGKAQVDNKTVIKKLEEILTTTKKAKESEIKINKAILNEAEKTTEEINLLRDEVIDSTKETKKQGEVIEDGLNKLVKAENDQTSTLLQGFGVLFTGLITTITTLVKRGTFRVQPTPETFLTPQYVVLYDPQRKTAANLKALGGSTPSGRFSVNAPSEIKLKNGAGAVINPATEETLQDVLAALGGASTTTAGDGTRTVTTAGTRVQLSATSVPCRRVIVQAHLANGELDGGNGAIVVVGGSTCVAEASARRGIALFPNNSHVFEVTDLNSLYIDSTFDGAKVTYYYEVSA